MELTMQNPISSATEEKVSAGIKFDTGTELPKKFELTDEFKDTYNLINETDKNKSLSKTVKTLS